MGGASSATTPVATTSVSSHVVALMMVLARVQQDARNDAIAARAASVAPKTVSTPFKTHNMTQLLFLTGAAAEVDLPKIWACIVEENGKRERETIEQLFLEVAANTGDVDQAPVVTPDLAKKIVTLCFAGTNVDDLLDGINPFIMVTQDHTSPDNEKAYFASLATARDCDDLVSGSTAMDLTDLKSLQATVKVQVPTTCCRDVLTPHLWRAVSAAIGVHCAMFPRKSVLKEMQFVGKNNL